LKKPILIGLIILNTLVMMGLTFYLMKLPWLAGDEKFLIWSTSALKFSFREVPDSEDFAFINTSYDLQLIDKYDDFGFPVGNQVITDRQKLTQLLEIIKKGEKLPIYTVLDVQFVDPTEHDSALQHVLENYENIILSSHLSDSGELDPTIFNDVQYGISDYVIGSVFEGVYKYQLMYQDSLKMLPLKIHENLSGESISKWGPFIRIGDRWTMNNFIMNYRLLQKDILSLEAGFNPVSLGELLYLPDEEIQSFVEDKILIIGDFFEQDMHETIFEITSGPLILLNAYLTIREQDTTINVFFLAIMIMCYAYLSYMALYEGDYIEQKIQQLTRLKASRYFIGLTSYFLILCLFSIVSFFLFNIHINVFFLALAFYGVDRVVNIIRK
jgi:hypothetical protein